MKPHPSTPVLRHVATIVPALALLAALAAAPSAHASPTATEPSLALVTPPSAADFEDGSFTCTPEHLAVVREHRERIAAAPTVEEARRLALRPAQAARHALRVAGLVAPSSERLSDARGRLEGFEDRVQEADSPAAVAGEFDRLLGADLHGGDFVQVADLNVGGASVRGPGECHYSTGEIIAIVIGFLLFIIPGIILLFVLC